MNDILLIKACQKGDKQAFNDLFELYFPYISGFLLKLTADEQLAYDLTQETFIKMIRNIGQFDVHGKAAFSTYLVTVANRLYIDCLRKNQREILPIDGLEISAAGFEDKALLDFEFLEIMQLIEKLPALQGEAIKLKYLEGLTLAEIAKKQNTQPKTIKSRIHSGIARLRKNLNTGGAGNG